MKSIAAIVGPTASGKTPLSLKLAEIVDAEIISADSRQIYRYLDIGTAKPSEYDLQRVKHHFISFLDPADAYSAGQYGKEARGVIGQLLETGKVPILVGGSGLYVKAVVDGLFDGPGMDEEIRERLREQLDSSGIESLLDRLRLVDPVSATAMGLELKARRIMRALEVHEITGVPLSQFHREQESRAPFEVKFFGLKWERKELYRRIDRRVDRMIAEGLIDEVDRLQTKGYSPSLNSLNTVGYKEIFSFFKGELSRTEAIDRIKQSTRRFAKRQLTWFNADKRIEWIGVQREEDVKNAANQIRETFSANMR